MKKVIKCFNLCIGAFIIVLLISNSLTSCLSDKKQAQCTILKPDKEINLIINNLSIPVNVWVTDVNKNYSYSYAFSKKTISNNELKGIIQGYNFNNQIPEEVFNNVASCIFYTGDSLKNNQLIINNEIFAALIYSVSKNDELVTTVLKNQNGKFYIIDELTSKTSSLTTNDIYSINLLLKQNGINYSSSVELRSFDRIYKRKVKNENFKLNINRYQNKPLLGLKSKLINNNTLNKLVFSGGGHDNCARPCATNVGTCSGSGGSNACEPKDPPSDPNGSCFWIGCIQIVDQTLSENASKTQMQTLYDFKDNYLSKSNFGTLQIESYYYVSSIIYDKIDLSLAEETLNLISKDVLPIINKLLTNPSNNSEILISSDTKKRFDSFLEKIQPLSDDQTYQTILNEIRENLTYVENMPTNQVDSEINKF